jgi:hypothetical protein
MTGRNSHKRMGPFTAAVKGCIFLQVAILAAAAPASADSWNTSTSGVIFPTVATSKFSVGQTVVPSESFKAEIKSGDPRGLRLSTASGAANPNVTLMADPGANNAFFVINSWDGGIIFSTGGIGTNGVGAEKMRIPSSGAVTVSGDLTANVITANTSFKVKTWTIEVPDYVFDEKRYKPMSLPEVESYVKRNKHLPDVPPAAQLKRDGIDVAEMNLILLKKVEELTLHAIEQDKKIKALSERLR